MSKLDYLTIGIVVVCIAAIIFLIVKITGLMNDDQPGIEPNRIEQALGSEEKPLQDSAGEMNEDTAPEIPGPAAYDDPDDDEVEYYDPVGEENQFEGEEPASIAGKPGEVAPDYQASPEEELTPRGGTAEKKPAASETRRPSIRGKYMVLAGSFRYKSNAEQMVRKLKDLGYDEAELGYTNKGAYAVALVNRFDDLSKARSLVNELESKHEIEAIVKTEE